MLGAIAATTLFGSPCAVAQDGLRPIPREAVLRIDELRQMLAGADSRAREGILWSIERTHHTPVPEAESDRAEREYTLLWIAGEHMQDRRDHVALGVLALLDEDWVSPMARQQALRLMGQVHHRRGDLAEAAGCFDRQVAICERYPAVRAMGGCASGLNQLAVVRRSLGQHDVALAANDRTIAWGASARGSNAVAIATRQRGVNLAAMGRTQEALDAADAYLTANPEWGLVDGQRVTMLDHKSRLLGQLGRWDECLVVARETWEMARGGDEAGALRAGDQLVMALRGSGRNDEALDVRREMVRLIDRVERARGELSPSLVTDRESLLASLAQGHRFGRSALAVEAGERLRQVVTDPGLRGDIERDLSAARDEAARPR